MVYIKLVAIPVALFLAFLFITPTLHSQTVNDVKLSDIDVHYLIVKGYMNLTQTKVKKVEIDFGQRIERSFWGNQKNAELNYENGEKVEMNSLVDILNFFAEYGYELKDTLLVGEGGRMHYEYILVKKEE